MNGSSSSQYLPNQAGESQVQQTFYTTPTTSGSNGAWPHANGQAAYVGQSQLIPQGQAPPIGLFEPDFELMKRQFDSVSISGAPGPAVASPQQPHISTSGGPSPNVGYPGPGQPGFDPNIEASKKTRFSSAPSPIPGGQMNGPFAQGKSLVTIW